MARIRTIKPEFFRHEALYEAERASGLPLRLVFAGLWTACDREGRFKWRPRALKLDILPYDDCDFSKAMDALFAAGFVVKYEVGAETYGHIPSWATHQHINQREPASQIPAPDEDGARTCKNIPAHGEGKGREGELEGKGSAATQSVADAPPPSKPTPLDFRKELWSRGVIFLTANGLADKDARSMLGKWRQRSSDFDVLNALASAEANCVSQPVPYVTKILSGKLKIETPNGQQKSTHPLGIFGELLENERRKSGFGGQAPSPAYAGDDGGYFEADGPPTDHLRDAQGPH